MGVWPPLSCWEESPVSFVHFPKMPGNQLGCFSSSLGGTCCKLPGPRSSPHCAFSVPLGALLLLQPAYQYVLLLWAQRKCFSLRWVNMAFDLLCRALQASSSCSFLLAAFQRTFQKASMSAVFQSRGSVSHGAWPSTWGNLALSVTPQPADVPAQLRATVLSSVQAPVFKSVSLHSVWDSSSCGL